MLVISNESFIVRVSSSPVEQDNFEPAPRRFVLKNRVIMMKHSRIAGVAVAVGGLLGVGLTSQAASAGSNPFTVSSSPAARSSTFLPVPSGVVQEQVLAVAADRSVSPEVALARATQSSERS